jgi:hypothetical protein
MDILSDVLLLKIFYCLDKSNIQNIRLSCHRFLKIADKTNVRPMYQFMSFSGKQHIFNDRYRYTEAVLSDTPEPMNWLTRPSYSVGNRWTACGVVNTAQHRIKNLDKYNIPIPDWLVIQSIPTNDCWS